MGELPTFDGPHLHQRAPRALSTGMLGIRGGSRAVPSARAGSRSQVPPAHGHLHARLEAAPREAALRGCPFQRASRHARLCPRTRDPLRSRRDVRDLPACVEMKRDKKARNTTKIVQRWKKRLFLLAFNSEAFYYSYSVTRSYVKAASPRRELARTDWRPFSH